MPTTGPINGTNVRFYIGANPVGYATTCTLNVSRAELEAIHKDNPQGGWKETTMGQKSGTMTVDGLFNQDATNNKPHDLFTALDSGTLLTCLVSTDVTGDTRLEFSCYCNDYSETHAAQENSSFSAGFVINGAITKATI